MNKRFLTPHEIDKTIFESDPTMQKSRNKLIKSKSRFCVILISTKKSYYR